MKKINCPNCGHDIDQTCLWFTEEGEGVWGCSDGDCDCDMSPSNIARALPTAEPTEAEVEAATLAVHQTLAPDWMSVAGALGGNQERYEAALRAIAIAALRAARGDELSLARNALADMEAANAAINELYDTEGN